MKRARRVITVTHPEHGAFRAAGVRDRLEAVQAAARAWGRQWSAIARQCRFRDEE